MYRRSYYYYQIHEPRKERNKREQVEVDVDKFSMKDTFLWVLNHGQDQHMFDPAFIAAKLFFLTMIFVTWRVVNIPIKRYYDYQDPLLKDKDGTLDGISTEATFRRLKYKKKISDWQLKYCC